MVGIGGELALHFFATTRLGAYYYVLSSLGMLTAATAVVQKAGRRG